MADLARIIAYTGAHGTGKTTAVFARARALKMEHPGASVGILCEVAQECPWPINQAATPEGQRWIFSTHMSRELAALRQYDLVVVDRTALDAVAYTAVAGFTRDAEAMAALFARHQEVYREIRFLRGDHLHADGVRDLDRSWRAQVDECLMGLYLAMGMGTDPRFSVGG